MVVDQFVRGGVERDEGGGDEAGGGIHVAVGACGEGRGGGGGVRQVDENQTWSLTHLGQLQNVFSPWESIRTVQGLLAADESDD